MESRDRKELEVHSSKNSDELETQIKKAHIHRQFITQMRYGLESKYLIVPEVGGLPVKKLQFTDTENPVKSLLYKALIASYNFVFFNDFSPSSGKANFSRIAPLFTDWLNLKKIDNKFSLLKEFETDYFDSRDNHGGYSPLIRLKVILFNYAYKEPEFVDYISSRDADFLTNLRETKASAQTSKKQASLASYFGSLQWLRDDEHGVGQEMYRMFASPKLTVGSLVCLSSTIILEFYNAKIALKNFFSVHKSLRDEIKQTLISIRKAGLSNHDTATLLGRTVFHILHAYHKVESPPAELSTGVNLFVISSLSSKGQPLAHLMIKSSSELDSIFRNRLNANEKHFSPSANLLSILFSSSKTGEGPMFSMELIGLLSNQDSPIPISQVEKLMFTWLMASLAVQPTFIRKLTKKNFRLFRVNQRVVSVECEYFKPRANAIHTTRSLSTKNLGGKALQTYLNQNEGDEIVSWTKDSPSIGSGSNSILGCLVNAMSLKSIDAAMNDAHLLEGNIPVIMPRAIASIVRNDANISKRERTKNIELGKTKEFSPNSIFGVQAIKNSSVHAYSDPYTLHYLINYNSHSNETEKTSYLTLDNEEWINAAGRITRNVMIDLINNVFDINFKSKADYGSDNSIKEFNQEFENISQAISYKSEEMFSRLQVVTQQNKGRINEVGVLAQSAKYQKKFEPIYVLDSPITVCKMKNYLYEFKRNHRKLLSNNPDYFYKTVLPTAEWMQQVLSTELCRDSILDGEKLFEKMQKAGVSMQVFHSI